MATTLLLIQYASQNIALFCCALYAGAATYVSLVENPTMTEGGVELIDAYVLSSHPRPVILQASFGVLGAAAGMLAGVAGGSLWWLAGGALLALAAGVHVRVVMPLRRRCIDIDPGADRAAAAAEFAKLVKLHAALGLAGLASLFIFIMAA